jgi:hypothetical protein
MILPSVTKPGIYVHDFDSWCFATYLPGRHLSNPATNTNINKAIHGTLQTVWVEARCAGDDRPFQVVGVLPDYGNPVAGRSGALTLSKNS